MKNHLVGRQNLLFPTLLSLLLSLAVQSQAASGAAEYDPTKPAAATPVAPAPAPPAKKSFLWEVASPTNKIYLFGTMHVGEKSFFPLPDAVENALKRAAKVVVEADISKAPDKTAVTALTEYRPPDTLDKKIPPPLYKRLKEVLSERFKVPASAVTGMKPVMAGGLLSLLEYNRLGYDMKYGVDAYIIDAAKKGGKPLLELESQLSQLAMLDGMTAAMQAAFLDNAVKGLENGSAAIEVADMVRAWQRGDPVMLSKAMTEADKGKTRAADIEDIILYNRHPEMADKIEKYLASGEEHFVAVGSLHLIGERGLLEMLRARGYKVTQQ